ncbi:hypothetical protein QBC35DRAFT_487095 [Podospora australis]|uniref:Uncharacterized protein n=1 Tax=Podospora australis TaxID=1536484 RepID=A0AAN6X3G7_9PEZI|nr:hypothetical protein QBC35DRAFT_487095 [Podospora australis]
MLGGSHQFEQITIWTMPALLLVSVVLRRSPTIPSCRRKTTPMQGWGTSGLAISVNPCSQPEGSVLPQSFHLPTLRR